MKVEFKDIKEMLDSLSFKFYIVEGSTITACWAFLPCGFQVGYGQSGCIDPTNFNKELGEKYAKQACLKDAEDKLWAFEGYKLKFGVK